MNWILALLGIFIYFANRYKNRKKKTIKYSGWFWVKDNAIESLVSIATTIVLVIIFTSPESNFDISPILEKIPLIKSLPTIQVLCFCAGFFNISVVYEIIKVIKSKFSNK